MPRYGSVEITLEKPTPYFLQALTHYTAYPVPQHVIAAKGDNWTNVENIVGNGPYKIVEWVPGNYIKSIKSETYYGAATSRSTRSTITCRTTCPPRSPAIAPANTT